MIAIDAQNNKEYEKINNKKSGEIIDIPLKAMIQAQKTEKV